MSWPKAETVPGRHPETWRKDAAVCKRLCKCLGCLCFQYYHMVPFPKDKELDIIEMAVCGCNSNWKPVSVVNTRVGSCHGTMDCPT